MCLQSKHLRDKLGKLLRIGWTAVIGPPLLADLQIVYRMLGRDSGIDGSVLDMSNSSQNNKRSDQMASFQTAMSLLEHVPMSKGTAAFVTLSAAHLSAFRDIEGAPPLSPHARVALEFFVHTVHVYLVLAVSKATIPLSPGAAALSRFPHTLQAHGFTAPTRDCLMSAGPALLSVYRGQAEDAAAGLPPQPVIPQEHGSQRCENRFSHSRDPNQQRTGAVTISRIGKAGQLHEAVHSVSTEHGVELSGKRSQKHRSHPNSHEKFLQLLTEEDVPKAIHLGFKDAQDFMRAMVGGEQLVQAYPTLLDARRALHALVQPTAAAARQRWEWLRDFLSGEQPGAVPSDAALQATPWVPGVLAELKPLKQAIAALGREQGLGGLTVSHAFPASHSAAAALSLSDKRRGDCIPVSDGRFASVQQVITQAGNTEVIAQSRNMLGRFQQANAMSAGLVKDVDAFDQGQDLRVGMTIVAVFQTAAPVVPARGTRRARKRKATGASGEEGAAHQPEPPAHATASHHVDESAAVADEAPSASANVGAGRRTRTARAASAGVAAAVRAVRDTAVGTQAAEATAVSGPRSKRPRSPSREAGAAANPPGGEDMFYAGVVRQIVAVQPKTKGKQQPYLSVSAHDETAVFFCHPWARVNLHTDNSTVSLTVAEEPPEYYPVATSSTQMHLVLGEDENADAQLFEREPEADNPADGGAEGAGRTVPVQMQASPILMRDYPVSWGRDGVSPTLSADDQRGLAEAITKHLQKQQRL